MAAASRRVQMNAFEVSLQVPDAESRPVPLWSKLETGEPSNLVRAPVLPPFLFPRARNSAPRAPQPPLFHAPTAG